MTSPPLRIAIPAFKSYKLLNYTRWLEDIHPNIEWAPLSADTRISTELARCHGLLLPGGRDVHPRHFGLPEKARLCHLEEERDAIEFRAIDVALKLNLPILGICRGLQAVNVALGGSLIIDLPQAGITGHGKTDGSDNFHQVRIVASSLLADASTGDDVNSSHHQAVDQPAPTLRVTAHAPDGVVEAMEWMDAAGNGFLLLVQWHPERLESLATHSRLPGRLFIDAVSAFWQAA